MLIVTSDTVPGRRIVATLGLVRGNTIRTRHVGADIVAHLRSLVGGEAPEYTRMLAGAREQALDRMAAEAGSMEADAIVAMRLSTAMVMSGGSEVLAYGTAVRLAPADGGAEGA